MEPRWRSTPRHAHAVAEWIRREFAVRGLAPPHCTPEALARALERERQIGYFCPTPASVKSAARGGTTWTEMPYT